jgi:diguanylate cyclase (GGDEF)-like protein
LDLAAQGHADSQPTTANDPSRDKEYGTRFIEEELPHVIKRVVKEGIVPAIVFIDVDNLTVINKVHGWEVGNVVLDVVYESVRRRSFAKAKYKGRCGDDTFYSILFESDRAGEYCEKLRRDIFSYPWRRTCPKLHVSCTIGYATIKPKEHPYEWVVRAILGMLEGKREGPNTLQEGPQFSGLKIEEPARPQLSGPILPASFQRFAYESGPADMRIPRPTPSESLDVVAFKVSRRQLRAKYLGDTRTDTTPRLSLREFFS